MKQQNGDKPKRLHLSTKGLEKVMKYKDTKSTGFRRMYSGYAEMIAKALVGKYGKVTVDDIREILTYHDIELVGNLWNSFFKKANTNWVEIGKVKSKREVAKGRAITVWILG